MRRESSPPRDGWEKTIEGHGLAYHRSAHPGGLGRPYWDESVHYVFSMDEVLALEEQVDELHRMCLHAVEHVIAAGRYRDFAIPEWVAPEIARSWERRDPHLYGRFDLRYDGTGPAKLLEYNADTPTSLLESSVVQWFWLQDVHPGGDQWNSIHERLIDRWRRLAAELPTGPAHFAWTAMDETGEEAMTLAYLQETADQAGLATVSVAMEDIGWDPLNLRFVDVEGRVIRTLCKLYPWEWAVADPFGADAVRQQVSMTWIEPLWKMLLSNKALLAILWELYPGHPNLLPAYLDGPRDLPAHIAKPLLGREGASMSITGPDGTVRTGGGYGAEGYVHQAFEPLPVFDGQRPVLGAWVVCDEAAGLGIRETSGLITDNTSSFVPHRIGP
ncbi:putative glutathionylspermidine synthase [Planomonospora parontospora subsp. parontospora]|uniref:Glutathionylspermidine synthase n=2 Tax=Planomonospora parontospora TaxID=58119 RepID=A0AA37BFH9_9ACTN|nr:glutathionylspermidine synthase family protein [Planomonospora parontospora]GGK63797.1 putative glutathionylspermidine synthase [Planomonospora parontospora]GII08164.1 putative glutathionylspermidine synthase [Planomonospora parontospora subsp. parontospora]